MQTDRYMRVVLTVIAVCLVWICLRDVAVVRPAYASGDMDVNIRKVGGQLILFGDSLPVEVKNWP